VRDSIRAIIILVTAARVVIDTNVLAGALLRREGQNRDVLRACFEDHLKPLVGQALFLEYEDVLGRQHLFRKSPLAPAERLELFEAFLSICEWVQVYYLWRPNLRDEGDNHILELAVAGGASMIVTNNVADFRGSELRFADIRVLSPKTLLKELA
jgi:putative PIN family toxin of toxin-antitoxin system